MPSASAVVPSTQVTNPEISVLDKTAQWHLAYERFNDYTLSRADLNTYLGEYSLYNGMEKIHIMRIYDQMFSLGADARHFEMFVTAVIRNDESCQYSPD
jgi:hypothetical protein